MKKRGIFHIFLFVVLIAAVGLACSALSSTPTSTSAPEPTQAPEATVSGDTTSTVSSELVAFTDQNSYYSIQLPGDWKYTSGTDTNLYWDRFASPDEHAFIENIAYDDGTPWTGSQNGKGALYLLNNYYSNTGKEGDIRVSDDSIQKDGSERLTWRSTGGGYSGVSFFEVRQNRTTFLMFTIWWDNGYTDTYEPVLDDVVASYDGSP